MSSVPGGLEPVALPPQLALLPFRNRVLLPGSVLRIRCTSDSSVRLVEQELWQKDRGLIGVVPVIDEATDGTTTLAVPRLGGAPAAEVSKTPWSVVGAIAPLPTTPQQPAVGSTIQWHKRGVAARALHLSRGMEKPGGRVTYTLVLEGVCRFEIGEITPKASFHLAKVTQLDMTKEELKELSSDPDVSELASRFKLAAAELVAMLEERHKVVGRTKSLLETAPAQRLADVFVGSFETGLAERLSMLDAVPLLQRLSKAVELVDKHLQAMRVSDQIAQRVEGQLSKAQRDALLRQQLKAIKAELGETDEDEDELAGLEKKLDAALLPPHARKTAMRELKRLKKMQPQQPGYGSTRSYLELMAELPWNTSSKEKEVDLDVAKHALDSHHYGLEKVKQRIIEYLAVRKLKHDARGPVLCFVGPPGVGKTSVAGAIATALNRKFIRVALGGVRDEADIRGHRRTYVGSLPGRIIEGIKRAGVNNPVLLLDEIDKTGADVRGDPGAALLEVLDPEQNRSFTDHYLSVPFDLSKVVWVATANRVAPIPPPLLDRMELIELPGYTHEEKLHIAMRHLIPRKLDEHGVAASQLLIPEAAVRYVSERYTREAGVRNLAKHLAALCRAAAVRVAEHQSAVQRGLREQLLQEAEMHHQHQQQQQAAMMAGEGEIGELELEMEAQALQQEVEARAAAAAELEPLLVDEPVVEQVLGPPKYDGREVTDRVSSPGVTMGLVWTAVGGEVQFVEATAVEGKGELHLTGQLGDVIKESAQIALTWVRAHATDLRLQPHGTTKAHLLDGLDIHIHFPAGAVPKDGPSAGVTLITTIVSLLSRRCVRADTAMTGEVTLRGLVLPVGGVKEKVMAAHRLGLRRVILPQRNVKDLQEVPAVVREEMVVVPATTVEDVLAEAFEGGYDLAPQSRL